MKPAFKLLAWLGVFSEYAAAQAVIQALALGTGLWLVHLLPVREYALYTLALSVLTFLSVFSDLGVSSALAYFRRQTRIAGSSFGSYVEAAIALRRMLLLAGGVAGIGFMLSTGRNHDFSPGALGLVAAILIVAVWLQVTASVRLVLLRLAGQYRESYLAEVAGGLLRLAGVAAIWAFVAPTAWLAVAAGALGWGAVEIVARRRLSGGDGVEAPRNRSLVREAMRKIGRFVLPSALSAAYFSIQGPLVVWLSAYFAGTASIAEVGALGRLGVLFTVAFGFIGAVIVPRLSAITDDAHYLRRYLQSAAIVAALGAVLVWLAYAHPSALLVLLGDAYATLLDGVLLTALSAVLMAWSGLVIAVNNARGWVRQQPLALALYATAQFVLVASLDLSTTTGVLLFGVWSNAIGLLLQVAINAMGFAAVPWVAKVDANRQGS